MSLELTYSEQPFITQLVSEGWQHLAGNLDDPWATKRTSFADVLQERVLIEKIRAINLRPQEDGTAQPWLDDQRIAEAVAAITRIAKPRLMECNQVATERLLLGMTVEGLPDWDGGRGQTIQFID
jgi:type I restriction enzyme R subunit